MNASQVSSEQTGTAEVSSQSVPPRRILVIDDDADIRALCSSLLTKNGYQVDTAADGAEAWKVLSVAGSVAERFDVVITDHNMPKLTGLELIKKLRAAAISVPIVLISAEMPAEISVPETPDIPLGDLEWNRSLQVAAALWKPFKLDELVQTVKKILQPTVHSSAPGKLSQ